MTQTKTYTVLKNGKTVKSFNHWNETEALYAMLEKKYPTSAIRIRNNLFNCMVEMYY